MTEPEHECDFWGPFLLDLIVGAIAAMMLCMGLSIHLEVGTK